jgi:hypothetical protein
MNNKKTRYVETVMRDPQHYQCMEWKEPPTLPYEDRIHRQFLLNIFFDRQDKSDDFTSEDLCTTLTNAFSSWHMPPGWDRLTIGELETKSDITELTPYTARQLINELQRRGAMMKIDPEGDDGVYGKIIACPKEKMCRW